MPTVADIAGFLKEIGLVEDAAVRGIAADQRGRLLCGLTSPRRAGRTDICWATSVQGSVGLESAGLILQSMDGQGAPNALPCSDPKLAFAEVAHRFFPETFGWQWSATSEPVVHASALIGTGVVFGAHVSIGEGVRIGPNTCLSNVMIEGPAEIGANCTIGGPGFGFTRRADGSQIRFPHVGGVRVGRDVSIGSNTCIDRGALGDTVIGRGTKIDNLVHIAHNVRLGANCLVIANAMIAGSVEIGNDCWVAPSSAILNKVTIGAAATVGLGAVVLRDVPANATVVGNPARELPRGKQ